MTRYDDRGMVVDAACHNCGEPAGRPVVGEQWCCVNCGLWQTEAICRCCGSLLVKRKQREVQP